MEENFLESFLEEAVDQIDIAEKSLISYEKNAKKVFLEEAFRALHTLKGASYMFDLQKMGDFSHLMETIFDGIRNDIKKLDDTSLKLLYSSLDMLRSILQDPEVKLKRNNRTYGQLMEKLQKECRLLEKKQREIELAKTEAIFERDTKEKEDSGFSSFYIEVIPAIPIKKENFYPIFGVFEDLKDYGKLKIIPFAGKDAQIIEHWSVFMATDETKDTIEGLFLFVDEVEVAIHKLSDTDFLSEKAFTVQLEKWEEASKPISLEVVESFLTSNATKNETLEESEVSMSENKAQMGNASIRVPSSKIDELMNWVSELVTAQALLSNYSNEKDDNILQAISENLEIISDNLRKVVIDVSLVSINSLVMRFERLVRDLSKELNKPVNFIIQGEDTELDKKVIEILIDPLLHIIRNSMDHGIEPTQKRKELGKPEEAMITFNAYYSGTEVIIEISDDGKGIDPKVIKAKAIEKKLIDKSDDLDDAKLLNLIFHPGFSTADKITDVSGRGVGMDVVRKKLEEIRGKVEVISKVGEGTTIRINLPLSLSIMDGLLTEIRGTQYVFPLHIVERIERLPYQSLNRADKLSKSVEINGQLFPVLLLREKFEEDNDQMPDTASIILCEGQEGLKGFAVDNVKGQIQTVIRPLGDYYQNQNFISGSTILGDGKLALVFDANKLLNMN
ncbi:MAG: chemotaxis protein CheA [Bacteroidota bacterium]